AFVLPQSSCLRAPLGPGTAGSFASTETTAMSPTRGLASNHLRREGFHRGWGFPNESRQRQRSTVMGALEGMRRSPRERSLAPRRSTVGSSSSDSFSDAVPANVVYPVADDPRLADGGGGSGGGGGGSGGGGGDEGGAVGKTGGGGGDSDTRSSLKRKLLRKVATLNRGFIAKEADRVDIEEIVEMLELENPNPGACADFGTQSSPIAGRWQLLYTSSLDVLSLQLNPTITIGQIFQRIESDGRSIQNIIELQPPFAAVTNRILGNSVATLTVKLETEPVTDTRINLKFVRTEIKANSLFGRNLDLPSLGVDIPSSDKLRRVLNRGKAKVEDSKKKARDLTKKAKDAAEDAGVDLPSRDDLRGALEKGKEAVEDSKEMARDLTERAKDAADEAKQVDVVGVLKDSSKGEIDSGVGESSGDKDARLPKSPPPMAYPSVSPPASATSNLRPPS
ncbi:unnamed protein product, partial [Ascophyllum nodosum]